MKTEKHYHAQKTRAIAQLIARLVQRNPKLADDPEQLHATLTVNIPGYNKRDECLNCGASMLEYAQELDINDALLVFQMAKIIRHEQDKGITFTEANAVRVSSHSMIGHTQKCRTSKCAKLGLVAKAGQSRWSITTRGYAALRGDRVPKVRVVFRGQILDRPEVTTTFSEVFAEHGDKVRAAKKLPRHDHRSEYADYNQSDWVNVAGVHQGQLI